MQLECKQVDSHLIVRLSGELDLVAAAEFKRVVDEILDRKRVKNLYLNLQRVTFLDSSFLGAMFSRYRRLAHAGGRMGVISPPASVRPALELAGIFRMMTEFGSEHEAVSVG